MEDKMIALLCWVVFGLLVGAIAKFTHPGNEPVGFLPTLLIGVAGSFIGGLVNYMISGGSQFKPAGLIMSVLGGVLFCYIWRRSCLQKL